MTQESDVVCLGGGVAAEAIAVGLQGSGLTLAVVERELVRGEARGINVVVARADPAETARGYIHDFHGGAARLVADRVRGVLIGATLVTPRAGEIVGELVLAIKLRTPLKVLADVMHPFPAFNRVLGATLEELAAQSAIETVAGAEFNHHEARRGQ